jgi:hypothetical protein
MVALLVVWLAAAPGSLTALETDQYYTWGRPLADSTDAVNARFNLELERAIAENPERRRSQTCREVTVAYRKRLRYMLLHDIQVWAWSSKWVDRIPNGGVEDRQYRRTNLYSRKFVLAPSSWMPNTPTIEVAGVRFGTDKLAHLVSSGWVYYREYNQGLENGFTSEDATRRAVGHGIREENQHLGMATIGVLAIADLEASYSGLRFYIDLCDSETPVLSLDEDGWVVSRPIDLRAYVTPRWDESFQPPAYSKGRWRKVKPVLETYCDRLDDPEVVEMRRRYRERDSDTLVGEIVAERVAEGEIPDPSQFALEAVCGEPDPSRDVVEKATDRIELASPGVDPATAMERVVAEDGDRRRLALGLPGLKLSYPLLASASLAVMATSQPRSFDCTTPCDFQGFFGQIEPGLGGGKLSLGWSRVIGPTNQSGSLLRAGFIGAAYKLSVLRTWGDSGRIEAGRTYAGFEFSLALAQANIGIGLMYRVDGGNDDRWLVTGGGGWGF